MAALRKLPAVVANCDWSNNPTKRWMATAVLCDRHYSVDAPVLVGDLSSLIQRAREFGSDEPQKDRRSVLLGFDFPIGIPRAYAEKSGIPEFIPFLRQLDRESAFFTVCRDKDEICLQRPFYPHAPGDKRRDHLTQKLGIEFHQLLRVCEQARGGRGEAAALFWTMGAKQVGKGAITGWRDVIAPALREGVSLLWPFEGSLSDLLEPVSTVIAETYPAAYYSDIFGGLDGSKTDQAVRARAAQAIGQWLEARSQHLEISQELAAQIEIGFSTGSDDAFDAVIGLFGMLDVLLGRRPEGKHPDPAQNGVEGWILGQL